MREYAIEDAGCKTVFDSRGNPVEISPVKSGSNEDGDLYLYVKSAMKDCKEQSMNDRLTARFEEGFKQIKSSLSKL